MTTGSTSSFTCCGRPSFSFFFATSDLHGGRPVVLSSSRELDLWQDAHRLFAVNPLDHTTLAIAHEAGATHLIGERAHPRQLYTQLAYHLTQLQRMLDATDAECSASIRTISLLRALAELAFDQQHANGDDERANLARWLDVERRKFLMATKADAFAMLPDQIAAVMKTRPGLRRAAVTAVRTSVRASLAVFRARLQPEALRRLAQIPSQLVQQLERAIGHIGEPVPLSSIASLPVTSHAFAYDLDDVAPVSIGFARLRIERAAREELDDGLERGTRRAVELVMRDYDDIRSAVEEHVLETIDSWLETAKSAAAFARRAREGASEYSARAQISRWFIALAKISASAL